MSGLDALAWVLAISLGLGLLVVVAIGVAAIAFAFKGTPARKVTVSEAFTPLADIDPDDDPDVVAAQVKAALERLQDQRRKNGVN